MEATTRIGKNKKGYGYKYSDLSAIHEYLESMGISYYQYIEPEVHGDEVCEYIFTVPIIGGEEKAPRRGCRVFKVALDRKSNIAQEMGSGLTYARRYSLLMAFGLATEDDDGEALTRLPKREPVKCISAEQVAEISALISASKTEDSAFCKFYKIPSIGDLKVSDYESAVSFLTKKIEKLVTMPSADESHLPEAMK